MKWGHLEEGQIQVEVAGWKFSLGYSVCVLLLVYESKVQARVLGQM